MVISLKTFSKTLRFLYMLEEMNLKYWTLTISTYEHFVFLSDPSKRQCAWVVWNECLRAVLMIWKYLEVVPWSLCHHKSYTPIAMCP